MSANVEWAIPFTIQSSYGDLFLNDDDPATSPLGYFILIEAGCAMGRDLRVTSDPIPQADGQIHHRRFTDGYQAKLTIAFAQQGGTHPRACDEQLRLMVEELGLHLNDMLNDPGRLFWTPTGLGDQRLLDEARVFSLGRPSLGEYGTQVEVIFDTPFPYVIDFTQTDEPLADGIYEYLSNDGNVEMFPVIKVHGPTTAFTIRNDTTDKQLVYDSTRPGASAIGSGDYIEFDFFRNTAYLNGDGASRKAGIDVEASDFWSLVPGVNFVGVFGATANVLFNDSWA